MFSKASNKIWGQRSKQETKECCTHKQSYHFCSNSKEKLTRTMTDYSLNGIARNTVHDKSCFHKNANTRTCSTSIQTTLMRGSSDAPFLRRGFPLIETTAYRGGLRIKRLYAYTQPYEHQSFQIHCRHASVTFLILVRAPLNVSEWTVSPYSLQANIYFYRSMYFKEEVVSGHTWIENEI